MPQFPQADPWSVCLKCRCNPLQLACVHQHHIKAAGCCTALRLQPALRGMDEPLTLGMANAATCTTKAGVTAAAHFHKHHRAICGLQD